MEFGCDWVGLVNYEVTSGRTCIGSSVKSLYDSGEHMCDLVYFEIAPLNSRNSGCIGNLGKVV